MNELRGPENAQKFVSEKLAAKFPATTLSYSNKSCLIFLNWKQVKVNARSLLQKGKKGASQNKIEKPKDMGHFFIQKLEILISVQT